MKTLLVAALLLAVAGCWLGPPPKPAPLFRPGQEVEVILDGGRGLVVRVDTSAFYKELRAGRHEYLVRMPRTPPQISVSMLRESSRRDGQAGGSPYYLIRFAEIELRAVGDEREPDA